MKNQDQNSANSSADKLRLDGNRSNYFLLCHYFTQKVKRWNEMNIQATIQPQ